MVTQTAAGQQSASQTTQKVPECREAPAVPPGTSQCQQGEPPSVPAHSIAQPPHSSHPKAHLPSSQENMLPVRPQAPAAEILQHQGAGSPEPQVTLKENEPSPQLEPINISGNTSSPSQSLDFQIGNEEALIQTAQLKSSDIDDILKKVIEEERQKAERARNLASVNVGSQPEDVLTVICKEYFFFANFEMQMYIRKMLIPHLYEIS